MKKRNAIATNIIWNWCSQISKFFISLILVKLLLERLGNDGYGIWILVGSIIGYYHLFEMGIGTVCGIPAGEGSGYLERGCRLLLWRYIGAGTGDH